VGIFYKLSPILSVTCNAYCEAVFHAVPSDKMTSDDIHANQTPKPACTLNKVQCNQASY